MNLDERTALMNQVRHRLRPADMVLSEEDITAIKARLMGYAIAGNRDEVGSLAHTAYSASDAIGFLQFDLMDALNEIKRLRSGA
jgi:hypothetical protein